MEPGVVKVGIGGGRIDAIDDMEITPSGGTFRDDNIAPSKWESAQESDEGGGEF
jgi:hypothetical protein